MKKQKKLDSKKEFNFVVSNNFVSAKTLYLISEVLETLPADIRQFVLNKVFFIEPKVRANYKRDITLAGYCIANKFFTTDYLIYFDSVFFYLSRKSRLYIIAHEIGHAYLGHQEKEMPEKQIEREADDFAAQYDYRRDGDNFQFKSIFSYFKNRFSLGDRILIALIILVNLWIYFFLDKLDFLFKWAVFM